MAETRASWRKRKRSENEQGDRAVTSASSLQCSREGKSYFDTISEEAVENIIRFSSNKPRHPNWKAYIPRKFALSFLKSETVLSKTSRNLFLSRQVRTDRIVPPSGMRTHDTMLTVGTECTRRGIAQLMSELRETLTELKIGTRLFRMTLNGLDIAPFPQLKCLSLNLLNQSNSIRLSRMLSALGRNLEFLAIRTDGLSSDDVSAMAKFGKGLKGFNLSVFELENELNTMWESIGETLEEVSLSRLTYEEFWNITRIMHSCRRLRQVTVYKAYVRHDGIEALCMSLGKQLVSLTLGCCNIDPSRLGRIAAACTNVSINLSEYGGCSVAAFREMGRRACRVNVGRSTMEESEHESETLRRASEACENLVGMSYHGDIPDASFGALFDHVKPFLVDFEAREV